MTTLATQDGIRERSFQLALRVLHVVRSLPRDMVGHTLARQLLRAGTGIGANIEEAQVAHSRKDFVRKMNIARGEAREVAYWLRLIAESDTLASDRLSEIRQEAEEINRILTSIIKRTRANEECQDERVSSLITRNS